MPNINYTRTLLVSLTTAEQEMTVSVHRIIKDLLIRPVPDCQPTCSHHTKIVTKSVLTFRNRASYIQDGHTATLQTPHFIYFFNKYTY
jgi:hypothetical protein